MTFVRPSFALTALALCVVGLSAGCGSSTNESDSIGVRTASTTETAASWSTEAKHSADDAAIARFTSQIAALDQWNHVDFGSSTVDTLNRHGALVAGTISSATPGTATDEYQVACDAAEGVPTIEGGQCRVVTVRDVVVLELDLVASDDSRAGRISVPLTVSIRSPGTTDGASVARAVADSAPIGSVVLGFVNDQPLQGDSSTYDPRVTDSWRDIFSGVTLVRSDGLLVPLVSVDPRIQSAGLGELTTIDQVVSMGTLTDAR